MPVEIVARYYGISVITKKASQDTMLKEATLDAIFYSAKERKRQSTLN